MFGWDDGKNNYDQVNNNQQQGANEPTLGKEVLSGAAAFEGMRLFENEQRKEGKTVDHSMAKEMAAGFAGVEADRLAQTYGMNEVDKLEARHKAKNNAKDLYDQHYVQDQGADQYDPQQYQQHQSLNNY